MTIAAFRDAQIGVEVTPGSLVAATVHLNGKIGMRYAPNRVLREESRASMGGSNTYDDLTKSSTGQYNGRCVVREQPYFWASAMRGDPTISTPSGGTNSRQHLYTQPLTSAPALKSLSVYTGDNTEALANAGTYVTRIVTTGTDVSAWTTQCDLIGWDQSAVTALTPIAALTGDALSDTASILNRLTKLYIDAAGGTIGSTQKTGTAFSFTHTWNSGVTFLYTMDGGVLTPTGVQRDIPTCTLELTTLWTASTVTEFGHWSTGATRLVRLINEGSTIEGSIKRTARYDGAYVYTDFVPLDNERDGSTLGRLTLTAVEDATYTKKVEVAFINTLTAL